MKDNIPVEVVEDVEIIEPKKVNVTWEMTKCILPYVFWSGVVVIGWIALSCILDMIFI